MILKKVETVWSFFNYFDNFLVCSCLEDKVKTFMFVATFKTNLYIVVFLDNVYSFIVLFWIVINFNEFLKLQCHI